MNNYDIAGGRNMAANSDIHSINDITANNQLKGKFLEITSTWTFTGDISAPSSYTQNRS